jgi:hypothetical protein
MNTVDDAATGAKVCVESGNDVGRALGGAHIRH